MNNRLQVNRYKILEKIKLLLQKRETKGLAIEELEALAEGHFRLALLPDTPPQDAVLHLKSGYQIDASNPRYAYHLSRMYFNHGEFVNAQKWIKQATDFCPTSHRIWTHVSILHKELNKQYEGKTEYQPNALEKKSNIITKKIRKGLDHFEKNLLDFVPAKSEKKKQEEARAKKNKNSFLNHPSDKDIAEIEEQLKIQRILNPGTCRWSGIYDLMIEEILQSKPNKDRFTKIKKLLIEIYPKLSKRKGGQASVIILLTQMLLRGYSPKLVRQLAEKALPDRKDLQSETLDIVLNLMEAPYTQVPGLIAENLKESKIPPLLAAFIHEKRLLWRKLEFTELGKYTLAWNLIKESDKLTTDKEIKEVNQKSDLLIKALVRAAEQINSPPPELVEFKDDEPDNDATPVTKESFESLARQLSQLASKTKDIQLENMKLLEQEIVKPGTEINNPEAYVLYWSNLNTEKKVATLLEEIGKKAALYIENLFEKLRDLNTEEIEDTIISELEQTKGIFTSIKSTRPLLKKLKKSEKHLSEYSDKFKIDLETPSEKIHSILTSLQQINSAPPISGNGSKAPPALIVEELNNKVENLQQQKTAYFLQLKSIHKSFQSKKTLEANETQVLEEILDFIQETSNHTTTTIALLEDQKSNQTNEKVQELNDLQNLYKSLKVFGNFQRLLKKMPLKKPQSDQTKSELETPARQEYTSENGIAGLKKVLGMVDVELNKLVDESINSFSSYDLSVLSQPAFHTIYISTISQAAEVLFRTGHVRKSEQLWQRHIRISPLDEFPYKNLAICKTLYSHDHGSILFHWKQYLEICYFRSIVQNDPRIEINKRIALHHHFSTAYSGGLLKKDWSVNLLVDIFNDPSRFREFIHQKILEFFNRKLDFTLPYFILGQGRTASVDEFEIAQNFLTLYVEKIEAYFPERIARRYQSICKALFENACQLATNPEELLISKGDQYYLEENRLIEWYRDVFMFIHHFRKCLFTENRGWIFQLNSIDFVFSLLEFDDLLDMPNEAYKDAALQTITEGGTEKLKLLFRNNTIELLKVILNSVIHPEVESPSKEMRLALFKSIIKNFVDNNDFWLSLIEDENVGIRITMEHYCRIWEHVYPEEILKVFSDIKEYHEKPEREVFVAPLARWCKKYPTLTESAYVLAQYYLHAQQVKESKDLLEDALLYCYNPALQDACEKLLADCDRINADLEFKEMFDKIEDVDSHHYELDDFLTRKEMQYLESKDEKLGKTLVIFTFNYGQALYSTFEHKIKGEAVLKKAKLLSEPLTTSDDMQISGVATKIINSVEDLFPDLIS